ncbi:MAG: LPS export ABC transporter permease LptF, partial [Gammaproteobacteria bacterium]|nr:LPS export ABC transporter permease LptF [Gammaproteobacteria bacterium]
MIINRYLIDEISRPLAAVLGVLVTIFASYSAAGFLSDAVNGLLPADTVIELIALKTLIALEVLIPISLYISVVLSLGKLYSDSELTAMFALRVTPVRVMGAVLTLSGILALMVAGLSLNIRPWAYVKSHELSARAEAAVTFNDMEAGTFYEGLQGDRVIFIGQRHSLDKPAKDVFIQLMLDHRTRIIHAQRAYQENSAGAHDDSVIHLIDTHVYEIGRNQAENDRTLNGKEIVLHLEQPRIAPLIYSSVAAGSVQLGRSDSAADIAELQWRLSTPLSTLLLGMLGVPLSRAKPRQGKYAKMGLAILLYS